MNYIGNRYVPTATVSSGHMISILSSLLSPEGPAFMYVHSRLLLVQHLATACTATQNNVTVKSMVNIVFILERIRKQLGLILSFVNILYALYSYVLTHMYDVSARTHV